MRKLNVLLLVCIYTLGLLGTSGCQLVNTPLHAEQSNEPNSMLGAANTSFSFDLFKALANKTPQTDVFISPASISLALAMAYNGAKGETAIAMSNVLGLQDMRIEAANEAFLELRSVLMVDDPAVQLDIANSLWAREDVEFYKEFLELNQDYLGAETVSHDFDLPDAAATINRWVEKQTNGKITDVVGSPIDPAAILFLINAIYFNAEWQFPFNVDRTKDMPFNLADGTTKQHPLMFKSGRMPYLSDDGFEAVELPYGETGRVSMYVFLPNEDSNLSSFCSQLTPQKWEQWLASFSDKNGSLGLPRFNLEYEETLNDVLGELGMGIAFSTSADFSGMRPAPPALSLSSVKHKTYINVDEKGTEAAAVTSVTVVVTSAAPSNNFSMTVDRPIFSSHCR